MIPGKPNRVKDVIERQKAELVAIAQELAAVKTDRDVWRETADSEAACAEEIRQELEAVSAERDSLRTAMAAKSAANEDLRERALAAEKTLRRVKDALDQVAR